MGQRAIFKRAKNPLKWDSHISGTAHTKKSGSVIFRGKSVQKTMKTEDKVKRKAKGRRKIERTVKNYDFRLIFGVKIRFLLSGTEILRGPKNPLKWDTHLSGTKRVFKEQST